MLNFIGFLTLKMSMAYTWTMVLSMQLVVMIPVMNLYLPSCLSHFLKQISLVNGYEKLIRDNFLARMYDHTDLAEMTSFGHRFEVQGYNYASFLDGAADILSCWLYALYLIPFLMMIRILFSQCWTFFDEIERIYRYQAFYKGFMVCYLKIVFCAIMNMQQVNSLLLTFSSNLVTEPRRFPLRLEFSS